MKFQLFGPKVSLLVANTILAAMLASASCVMIGERQIGYSIAVAVFSAFSIAVVSAAINGLDISCGCAIGDGSISRWSFIKPLAFTLVMVSALLSSRGSTLES